MGAPATTGRLCETLAEMKIGDYIRCEYIADTANIVGVFQNLGQESDLEELPLSPEWTSNGFFYFLKVDQGLLLADRAVQAGVSWDQLNEKNYAHGQRLFGESLVRLPTKEEWKAAITHGNLGGSIIKQDLNVWHTCPGTYGVETFYTFSFFLNAVQDNSQDYSQTTCWADGTTGPVYSLPEEAHGCVYFRQSYGAARVLVSQSKAFASLSRYSGYYNYSIYQCFRPALEYIDNPRSKTAWY